MPKFRRTDRINEQLKQEISLIVRDEVREGFECGLNITNFNDIKVGDILECYRVEEVARTLAGIAAEQERERANAGT